MRVGKEWNEPSKIFNEKISWCKIGSKIQVPTTWDTNFWVILMCIVLYTSIIENSIQKYITDIIVVYATAWLLEKIFSQ